MSNSPEAKKPDNERARLPAEQPMECLGTECPFYSGSPCEKPLLELLSADGDDAGVDLPPYGDDPNLTYAEYGRMCMAGGERRLLGVIVFSNLYSAFTEAEVQRRRMKSIVLGDLRVAPLAPVLMEFEGTDEAVPKVIQTLVVSDESTPPAAPSP